MKDLIKSNVTVNVTETLRNYYKETERYNASKGDLITDRLRTEIHTGRLIYMLFGDSFNRSFAKDYHLVTSKYSLAKELNMTLQTISIHLKTLLKANFITKIDKFGKAKIKLELNLQLVNWIEK
jgi:hypothetical protein